LTSRANSEGQGEQVVQLVDEARALTHDRLQPAGDLAQDAQLRGVRRRGGGSFAEGVARGGACLDGIGLFAAEQRRAIVLVALRIAAGDRDGERRGVSPSCPQAVQKVQQVVGVLSRRIEPDNKVNGVVPAADDFESLPELRVTVGRLGELQLGRGGLQVVAQEGGIVAVA
jgi:hypothetical protein